MIRVILAASNLISPSNKPNNPLIIDFRTYPPYKLITQFNQVSPWYFRHFSGHRLDFSVMCLVSVVVIPLCSHHCRDKSVVLLVMFPSSFSSQPSGFRWVFVTAVICPLFFSWPWFCCDVSRDVKLDGEWLRMMFPSRSVRFDLTEVCIVRKVK